MNPRAQALAAAPLPSLLAQHRGEVVLVNFWSTWCTPCRTEPPALQALDETYRERGFTVLA